ncbi:MAG: hypothetical protein GTO29_08180 [Candidatus Latescibacteria bacterium]|nr:hypothetical protein [Candidatus Latescibacterota bacterium]NIO56139.1 hypothetical protein [Candidatus Latescibacterota bacterium]
MRILAIHSALVIIAMTCAASFNSPLLATTETYVPPQKYALKVFLDNVPHQQYVKEHIPFINYVRGRKQAQVHILYTSQRTGSRATERTVTFTGQKEFIGVNDTLSCTTRDIDTTDFVRSEIVRIMKLELIRYVSRTPQAQGIDINYLRKAEPAAVADRWDSWVFSISIGKGMSGQESIKSIYFNGSITADRVTEAWKLDFGLWTDYSEERFDTDDLNITSISRSSEFHGLTVRSINDHWSIGGYLLASKSIYYNTDWSVYVAPAVEFNIFPYSESTYRNLRILYKGGYKHNKYDEETIYYETEEDLFLESLSITMDLKRTWGSFSASLEGSHYLHDFERNRLVFYNSVYLRLFEGLYLTLGGSYSRIRDQIELPRRGLSEDEVLLRRKQLATQYYYSYSISFSYRFGSKYSNIVNPRF